MAQRSVPKFVSDRTIDRVLKGSPFISNDNVQGTSDSRGNLDKMLGFDENNIENVNTKEQNFVYGNRHGENNLTTQKSFSLKETTYISSSSNSCVKSAQVEGSSRLNKVHESSFCSNSCTFDSSNDNNIMASSPELTYTPGKSRLDAASLARLKAKYGAHRSADEKVEGASSKPIRKESSSSRVVLSDISTNVDAHNLQEQLSLERLNTAIVSEPYGAINSEESSKDISVSEPASRIAPSPEPEVVDAKRNSRRANPVRFSENLVMGVSNTPIQIQTDIDDCSPVPTPYGQATQLAGRTPKIRYDVKLVDSEEKANNVVAAMNRQESLGRLWTADDFGTLSANSSPVERKQSPVASASGVTRSVSYSPTKNIHDAIIGGGSPTGLSTNLLLAETPEACKQFREMAKDLNAVVSQEPAEDVEIASESELNLTAEEIEENRRWQAEEDETNRLLALEQADRQREQEEFENQCRFEEEERLRIAEQSAASKKRTEEAYRKRLAHEEAERQHRVEEAIATQMKLEEAERQRRVEEEAKMQQREESVALQRRLEEAEKQQKLLLQQVQRQQQQLQMHEEQVQRTSKSALTSESEIIQTRSVSRSEASTATPYVSHFAQKSKYGGVIHLTKSPAETNLGHTYGSRIPTSGVNVGNSSAQHNEESPEMFSRNAAWKIQSNRAVMSDSRISPDDKVEQHHTNHQYTLDDSNATINMSLVGRSHSLYPPRQQQQCFSKCIESDDDVSQVSTGESFSTIQLGEVDHSTIAVSAFNRVPIVNSSHQAKPMPVSLGSLVSAPPLRATAVVNSSLCSAAETETSIEYTGVSLSHPHPRGNHSKNESAFVNNIVPRMDTTRINSPLKVPKSSKPLSAYFASHQHMKNADALPIPPTVHRERHVNTTSVPPTPGPVSDSYIVKKYLDNDVDEKHSGQTQINMSGASRVPIDEKYLDVCSEDYDDENDDSEELFKNINDDSTESDVTFTIPSEHAEVKSAPETTKKAVGAVSVATQVTPGLSVPSELKIDTFKEVNFEVSDDSSVDTDFEAKRRYPRSPYVKERLDDSENFEFGLEELLEGSNVSASKKSASSPSFSKSIQYSADTYSQQKIHKTSPDTLGSGPRRVIAGDYLDDDSSISNSEISGLDDEKGVFPSSEQGMTSSGVFGVMEEHAVVEMDDSALLTAATTLSLDSIDNLSELLEDEVPRMVLSQRQRKVDDCSDVKEIVVRGSVGVETTIVLPFTNKRDKIQDIHAKAVQMRFDTFKSDPKSGLVRSPKFTPGGANVTTSSFSVQPTHFQMEPGADASMYVRFAPMNIGVYSGVLRIRCGKKSFMLLLRGEATLETPRKALSSQAAQEENTPKTVQLNRSITFEDDLIKWDNKEETDISDKAVDPRAESRIVVSPIRTQQKIEHDVKVSCDPLLMKQKWMREWLNKASDRGIAVMTAAPAITTIARHNGVFPTQVVPPEECPTSASLSVIPSSLRLLPQRLEQNGKYGINLVSTGLLQGSLLVRNFADERVEIGIATSSAALAVKSSRIVIGAYDAVPVLVEYDPAVPSNATPGSPTDFDGAHVGYVMITSSSGEEFVADIKMPPKSCLSPYNPELDPLKANDNLREYINQEQAPCEMSSYTITPKDTSVVNDTAGIGEDNFEKKVKDKELTMIPTSPSRSNDIGLHEVSSPQDQGLLQRKRERAQELKEKRIVEDQKKEMATARGKEILAKTKSLKNKTGHKVEVVEAVNQHHHSAPSNQTLPHYMHPIHHKGGVHEFHGVIEPNGHVADIKDGKVVDGVKQGNSSSNSDASIDQGERKMKVGASCDDEVNTPIPLTPSTKLVKRMLIDKYSPGTSDAVVGLLKISSAVAANASMSSINSKPSIVSMTKKSMSSPRVSLTPTKTTVSPLKASLKKSATRSPHRGVSISPKRQVKSSVKKSVTKSGAATVLSRSSAKKTPATKYSCNAERIKERDEAVTKGVFFKKLFVEFGTVKVGSLTRQKVEVCNASSKDIVVVIKDPALPFVTLHNEIKVRANSFVRLPIRFVPVHRGHFEMDLVGKVTSTEDLIKIALVGDCF